MRLLYSSGYVCDAHTLKRLLLFADEIAFLDRPSVVFGRWGTIGGRSPARTMEGQHGPVTVSVHEPPSGPAEFVYQGYVRSDLTSEAFRQALLEGLRGDEPFAARLLQFGSDYGGLTGRQILDALLADSSIARADVDPDEEPDGQLYRVGDTRQRLDTFKVLMTEASIQITAALIVAAETGLAPISEHPTVARLLAMRTSDAKYAQPGGSIAAWLAAAVVESVVPDAAIQLSKVEDIFAYRERTRDAYRAFMGEIDRLAVQFGSIDPARAPDEIPRIIAAEVTPKVREYERELAGARDALFADVLKEVVKWEVPTLSVAFLSGPSFPTALAAFAAAVRAAAPPIIDYVKARRVAGRHAFAYLLGLRPRVRVDARG